MTLWDRLLGRKALSASPEVVEALQDRRTNFYVRLGGTNQQVKAAFERGLTASYGWMYAHQPAVRAVVDYIATSAAQLGLKLYKRVDDDERERDEDHPAAELMRRPDDRTPADAFIFRVFTDFLVYNNAYVLKFGPGRPQTLIRIPPATVTVSGGRFRPDIYRVWRVDGSFLDVKPEEMLHWQGYNPEDPLLGLSKLETLREQLTGDAVLQRALTELAKGDLKMGHIERPTDAPDWTIPAMDRFRESWENQKRSGRTPVLEEGMKYVKDSITPEDAELLNSRKFTREEVCKVYGMEHCPPEDDEERKAFYADVLAPITKSLAGQLCRSLLEAEYGERDYYFEFDLNEKMRGDAEARFAAITTAAGRPWLTVNEVRAMENKPPVDGGEELTIPLNVALGELPAPNVMPPQDPNKPPQDGSYRENPKALTNGHKALEVSTKPRREADMARQRRVIDEVKALLERYYSRQHRKLATKSQRAADTQAWNKELAADLLVLLKTVVEREGGTYAGRLGADDFDMREVQHYLKAMADGTAEGLNRVTQQDIAELGLAAAFQRAQNERLPVASANIGARVTMFSRQEAAKQSPNPELRSMEWVKHTNRHADLDGKRVPLGADWGGIEPGSEPNCACSVTIS